MTKVTLTIHEVSAEKAKSILNFIDEKQDCIIEKTPVVPAQSYPIENIYGVYVDSLGLPWSHIINTESRVCVKKSGEWKLKRNLPEETIKRVRDDLFNSSQAPESAVEQAPESAVEQAPEADVEQAPEADVEQAPESANESIRQLKVEADVEQAREPDVEQAPESGVEHETTVIVADNFGGLLLAVSPLIANGQLTHEKINTVVQSVGLVAFEHLTARPDLLPGVVNSLNELLK